jgi:hypothetical protein
MNGAIVDSRRRFDGTAIPALLPLIVVPAVVCTLLAFLPNWKAMWLLAVAIYAGLKWLTFVACPLAERASLGRSLGYLLFWPGMNAKAFLDSTSHAEKPSAQEWLLTFVNLSIGLVLLFVVVPRVLDRSAFIAGWIGMVGLSLFLHFGFAHLLSIGWRLGGINAEPIMKAPILASSLSDFWGRRWNRAFRDVVFTHIFRPLVGRIGVAWATMVVFIISGLVHDFVISVPVRGGWGGPTLYFVLQGVGLLAERSRLGRRLGLGSGLTGRLVCALLVVAPLGLLFHEPFVRHAILPTLAAMGIR